MPPHNLSPITAHHWLLLLFLMCSATLDSVATAPTKISFVVLIFLPNSTRPHTQSIIGQCAPVGVAAADATPKSLCTVRVCVFSAFYWFFVSLDGFIYSFVFCFFFLRLLHAYGVRVVSFFFVFFLSSCASIAMFLCSARISIHFYALIR